MKRAQKQEQKRVEAEVRQEEYDALTPVQKLDRAVARGHWNSKEAKRLRAAIAAISKRKSFAIQDV